jgi:hypothetical protein
MDIYKGLEVQLHAFLTLALMKMNGHLLSQEESPMYPFNRRFGGSQRLPGPFAENNNIWSLPITEPQITDNGIKTMSTNNAVEHSITTTKLPGS